MERFVTITPRRLHLRGFAGQPLKSSVRLKPEPKYPFKIVSVHAAKGDNIRIELNSTDAKGQLEYVITVENLKQERGRYFDTIVVDTDNTIRPQINISVIGNIIAEKKKSTS